MLDSVLVTKKQQQQNRPLLIFLSSLGLQQPVDLDCVLCDINTVVKKIKKQAFEALRCNLIHILHIIKIRFLN